MDINWSVIVIAAVLVLILVVLTIRKNQKEKKKLTDLLNNDFKKTENERIDSDDAANEK